MTRMQKPREREAHLLRVARFHHSHMRRSVCLLCSVLLLSLGVGAFIYAVHIAVQSGDSIDLSEVVFGLIGLMGVFAGWMIRQALCLARVTHELLRRLDDDYNRAFCADAEGRQREANPKCADGETSLRSPVRPIMLKLSTRSFGAGWRLLVWVPLVVGGMLLTLSIVSWQVPSLGDFLCQRGVFLDYLCLSGLVLIVIGTYVMLLGVIVHRRASRPGRKTQ